MGADLPYRKRVEYMLTTIFGKTFEKTSHWYGKPNPDAFFATVMKMRGEKVKLADGSEIFRSGRDDVVRGESGKAEVIGRGGG